VLLQARLSVELSSAAQAAAQKLPASMREEFVAQLTANAGNATDFGGSNSFALPPGVPAEQAAQLKAAALEAFHAGFTSATKTTLILPIVALVIGLVLAAGMGRRATTPGGAPVPKSQAEPTAA
jgi:hypothetical protein